MSPPTGGVSANSTNNNSNNNNSGSNISGNNPNHSKSNSSSNNQKTPASKGIQKYNCIICDEPLPGEEREKIYAIGKCNHIVCYVCSARLRAICDQSECPVCRVKLDNVIFSTLKKRSFDLYDIKDYIHDQKYGIYFENESLEKLFRKLLAYKCQKCTTIDATFDDVDSLKRHLNRVHRMSLCELCLKHDKLFPFEFSYYSPDKLTKHRKEGEENTSHRGHPMCQLCREPFFNLDELIAHMSREHFHCHLCHRDGSMRVYFNDYDSLREHFKSDHYLCERDHCREERFTSVFENEIDFRVHMIQTHGSAALSAGRAESRQFRTIPVQGIPRSSVVGSPSPSGSQGQRVRTNGGVHVRGQRNMATIDPTAGQTLPGTAAAMSQLALVTAQTIGFQPLRPVRLPCTADFPSLDGSQPSSSATLTDSAPAMRSLSGRLGPGPIAPTSVANNNNTPARIGISSNNVVRPSSTVNLLSQRVAAHTPDIRHHFTRSLRLDEDDFPPLPEFKPTNTKANKKRTNKPNKSNSNTNKPNSSANRSNSNPSKSNKSNTGGNNNNKKHNDNKANNNRKKASTKNS